jgi:pyruvate/2-oxoglutarate dehydrogenase complex dihydrolipoamide dehydrogenase (E3) component
VKFGERLAFVYEREGIRVLPSRRVVRILRDPAGFYEIGIEGLDGYEPIKTEKVLIATGRRPAVDDLHLEAGIAAENAVNDGDRKWAKRSNIQVVFSDPEFAFAGIRPADAEKAEDELVTASAESGDVGKLHLAGDDFGFGEFCADAKNARLLSAGLLCDDASNLIHLPAYAIDHEHIIHQLEDAEYYHPTKIEIISEIGDALCRKLGGHPFARAEE